MFENLDFDWDDGNSLKCQKHGVSKLQIEALFRSRPMVAPDILHSSEEDRLLAMGLAENGRRILVVFTLRDRDGQPKMRPVSARYTREKEFLRHATAGS